MKKSGLKKNVVPVVLAGMLTCQAAHAAISLDRTRVVFDGAANSVSMNVNNQNKTLPYLAQAWLEDDGGSKIQGPLTVLPPLQRVEPGKSTQVRIEALPGAASLPQDRETLYYFNLREIPPKSSKANTLQIALQTRVKLFYRPAGIAIDKSAAPPQEQLTLSRDGTGYQVHNPTPYYVTIVDGRPKNGESPKDFQPLMLAPFSSGALKNALGNSPELFYINDYGGRPSMTFSCAGTSCTKVASKKA